MPLQGLSNTLPLHSDAAPMYETHPMKTGNNGGFEIALDNFWNIARRKWMEIDRVFNGKNDRISLRVRLVVRWFLGHFGYAVIRNTGTRSDENHSGHRCKYQPEDQESAPGSGPKKMRERNGNDRGSGEDPDLGQDVCPASPRFGKRLPQHGSQ